MLSYSKNRKVKGSGYVIDIPDNFTIEKGTLDRDFIAYIPDSDCPDEYVHSDFIIFAAQQILHGATGNLKTVAEFCSLAEATGTTLGDVETARYERRDLPGAVLFSLLGPDCLHAQLLVGIDDHLQQMRVQISNVNSQNRAKYKKMAMEIFDHIRADKPVTLLEELDAKKYISMSDGSKTISEWNGLIQEYIDHIGIARDILQSAIVNSFSSNPVTGFEKLKKDIRQMLKNISGEVDKELVKAEAIYTLKRAEYPDSPSLKGMRAALNSLIGFAYQEVELLGENVAVKSSIASGVKTRLNKPVANVIDIISGDKSELNENVKNALRKAKPKSEKSAAVKSSGTKEKAPPKAGSGAKEKAPSKADSSPKKKSRVSRELEYLPPELLDVLEIMCKSKMNRAKAEDVQKLLSLSSLPKAIILLGMLTKKDYLTEEFENGCRCYTPNENARAILYHTARERRERRQKRQEAEREAKEWSIMVERNKEAVQSYLARVDEYKKLVDAEVTEREAELRAKSQQNIDAIEEKRLTCEKKLGELGLFSFSEKKSTKEEIARLKSEADIEKKNLEDEIGSLYTSGTKAVNFYKRRVDGFLKTRYNMYADAKQCRLSLKERNVLGKVLAEIYEEAIFEKMDPERAIAYLQAKASRIHLKELEDSEKILDLMADGKARNVADIVDSLDLTYISSVDTLVNALASVSLMTKSVEQGDCYYKLSDNIYEHLDEHLAKTHSPYARYADNLNFLQLECPAIPNPKVTV